MTELVKAPGLTYTPEQLVAIRKEYAGGATDEQFIVFITECQQRNLIPGRHVYFQLRRAKERDPETGAEFWSKRVTMLTSIDAFRLIAQRTGEYRGQKPTVWIYFDTNKAPTVRSTVPLPNEKGEPRTPWAAETSVLRKGFEEPITAVARFDAYAVTYKKGNEEVLTNQWVKRSPEQIAKCSEALALRKAFPEELGGLYVVEELANSEENREATVPAQAVEARAATVPGAVNQQPGAEQAPRVEPQPPFAPTPGSPQAPALATPDAELAGDILLNRLQQTNDAEDAAKLAAAVLPLTAAEVTAFVNRVRHYTREVLPKAGMKTGAAEKAKQFVFRTTGKKSTGELSRAEWETVLGLLDAAQAEGIPALVKLIG